jgi:UDP-N-acetylglucosamine--N-acetylmuramyl-(pentapeptide) pyrophosphoryl-undecaprenol N-acetylglucosamine transferase
MGIPTAILNPDAVPGRANRYLSKRVDAIFAQWPGTQRHFRRREVVHITGCPVRRELLTGDQWAARHALGLDPDKKTLLVTGASQGARTINLAMLQLAPKLRHREEWQVLHLAGNADVAQVTAGYEHAGLTGQVLAFTNRMHAALWAADLVISRAGASTLAELTVVGRPAILLPYPFHRDQHQRHNAEVLATAGAAILLPDRKHAMRNARELLHILDALMDNSARLQDMQSAARGLGRPRAAEEVAEIIARLAGL